MARIRTIKPEMWGDEKFSALDSHTQVVYIGLISQADDAGRLVDSVRLIDGLLWPFDETRTSRESLRNLSRIGLIHRGETRSGQRVIQIVGWSAHQRVDKPNMKAALPPIVAPHNNLQDSKNNSGIVRESIQNDSRPIPTTYDLRPTIYDQRPASETRTRENGDGDVLDDLDPNTLASIRGLYGWEDREGTDERVWGDTPKDDRPRLLRIAVQRLAGEGARYQGKLFRRTLESVIAEQRGTTKAGTEDLSHWED